MNHYKKYKFLIATFISSFYYPCQHPQTSGYALFSSPQPCLILADSRMPKRKNHTGRNATVKAHANGIKKARRYPAKSLKGVSSLFT